MLPLLRGCRSSLRRPKRSNYFSMNVITWNVRGVRRPAKRFLVKGFLNLHFADVCCLQETKLEKVSNSTWIKIGGYCLDHFIFLPARGYAGGTILGWNSALLTGNIDRIGAFNLPVDFCSKKNNFK